MTNDIATKIAVYTLDRARRSNNLMVFRYPDNNKVLGKQMIKNVET